MQRKFKSFYSYCVAGWMCCTLSRMSDLDEFHKINLPTLVTIKGLHHTLDQRVVLQLRDRHEFFQGEGTIAIL